MIVNISRSFWLRQELQEWQCNVCPSFQPIFQAQNYSLQSIQSMSNSLSSSYLMNQHIQGGVGRGLPGSRSDQGLWRGVFPRPRVFPPPPLHILTPEPHCHNIRPGTAAASRPSPGWSRGNEKCQAQVSSTLSNYSLTFLGAIILSTTNI